MNYFLMLPLFEYDEGQYQKIGDNINMMNITAEPRVFYNKPIIEVQTVYKERGGSDYLKCGSFLSASNKVQHLFFMHGFHGIQFIPLLVNNNGTSDGYAFVHKIATYDILDPILSEADNYDEEDNDFSFVLNVYLDKNKFKKENIVHDIFMCSNYCSEFICNERVKSAIKAANITGIKFKPVEFSS